MPELIQKEGDARRGFVIGELLLAVLLLTVAVSSLAALMYSVSHHSAPGAKTECVASSSAKSAKCGAPKPNNIGGGPKLLRSAGSCESGAQDCKDATAGVGADGTVLKSRTDSASLALLARNKKQVKQSRPDLGFVR